MAPAGAAAERQRKRRLPDERSGRYCFSETCGRPRPHEWEGPASTAQREEAEKAVFLRRRFFDDLRKIAFSANQDTRTGRA